MSIFQEHIRQKNASAASAPDSTASIDNLGRFTVGHPQSKTHVLHLQRHEFIPVILGRQFARPDAGDNEKNEWCKAMLALFKP
jgi:hypothetical protein